MSTNVYDSKLQEFRRRFQRIRDARAQLKAEAALTEKQLQEVEEEVKDLVGDRDPESVVKELEDQIQELMRLLEVDLRRAEEVLDAAKAAAAERGVTTV